MTNRHVILPVVLLFVCAAFAPPARAQQVTTEELKKQVDALSQSVQAMQKDLQEIKAFLQGRVPPARAQSVVLDLGGHPFRGENTARLTLVEFSDYQCPFCGRFVRETVPQFDKEYVQTGKVKYVFLDLPLESIHATAFKAAEAAHCAGEQGKFWEMHDRLYANQQALEPWTPHAQALGLDVAKFDECLSSGRQAARIRADVAVAQKAGLTSTPSFVLAYTDPKSATVSSVAVMIGVPPYAALKTAVDKLLANQPDAPQGKGAEKK